MDGVRTSSSFVREDGFVNWAKVNFFSFFEIWEFRPGDLSVFIQQTQSLAQFMEVQCEKYAQGRLRSK